jgi:hypothetical protein
MYGTVDRRRDEQILMALHLVQNMGMTNRHAGELIGMTKKASVGVIARVRREEIDSIAENPANKDCSQKPLWWFDPTSEFGLSVLDKIARLKQHSN